MQHSTEETQQHLCMSQLRLQHRVFGPLKMTQEISDAVKEKELTEAAIAMVKLHHTHDDGSEVILTPLEDSGIEQKLIREENEWKMKTAANQKQNFNDSSSKQPEKAEEASQEPLEIKKEEKTVVAGCNCGEIFASTFSKGSDKSDIKIKTYDSSGNPAKTYSVSGSQQGDYTSSGPSGTDYAKQ